jgi:hypothetical protein
VTIAVVVSLGLAAQILTVGSPLVAVGAALAMLAFTALDIRELPTRCTKHAPAGALAATVAVLHLLAAAPPAEATCP